MEARCLDGATRLSALNEEGRSIEGVAIVLRMGEESEKTARRLNEMDLEFLDWWSGGDDSGRSAEVGSTRDS